MASPDPPPNDLLAYGAGEWQRYSFEDKLTRALEHLHAAQAAVTDFLERDPGTTVLEQNGPKGEMAIWYRAFMQPDPKIAPPIFDCIHNLRQALDHLAYRLAVTVSGVEPPPNEKSCGFPIYGNALSDDHLRSKIGDPTRIPAEMRAALERAQPHAGGRAKLLAVLHDLDILDKHRFPPLVTVGAIVSDVDIRLLPAEWVDGPRIGPVEDGAEIIRWKLKPGTHEVDMQFRCVNQIAFGKPSPAEGINPLDFLQDTREYIRTEIVSSFAQFLWPPAPAHAAIRLE